MVAGHDEQGMPDMVTSIHLIDRNALDEYSFVGDAGDKVTTNADKLLSLIERRRGAELAGVFARPRFDERRTQVMWFTGLAGRVEPFTELSDADQLALLDRLAGHRAEILALAGEVAQAPGQDARIYALMLPLLLNFPEPVEYHLFRLDGRPVVTNWGMNKGTALAPRDTVGPFMQAWRARLDQRDRQAREAAEAQARETSFFGRLTRAGARSGAVTVSLLWNDLNDLDLHIQCPTGERISFVNKQACGGILDVDRNAHAAALTREPVENVVWTRPPEAPGRYGVFVHHFRRHDPDIAESHFTLRLKRAGRVAFHEGVVAPGEMCQVTDWDV